MAVFHRIPPAVLRRDYRYRGWMFGFVPVYVGPIDDAPNVSVRNWVPEWLLDLGHTLFCALVAPLQREPEFPLVITGRLDGAPLDEDPTFRRGV